MLTGKEFDFRNLFTFEMANNHQGSVNHGLNIIKECAKIAKEFKIRAAVKLQLRNLDTLIHPAYRNKKDVKHIPRFLSTALSVSEFKTLVDETKKRGLITMATPFDEDSVDLHSKLGVEILKVASCSCTDWPLLEKIVAVGKPIIVSIGGLETEAIDRVVSFFEHRGANFALMHCVAIYPTPHDKLFLKQIEFLRERYPRLTIGFSTHESPTNTDFIGLAYAKGARIFEKHVGIPTKTITLNSYSANPEQLRAWVAAYRRAVESCGDHLEKRVIDKSELNDLQSLKRCVFAKQTLKKGQKIKRSDVFFAMPLLSSTHLTSSEFREDLIAEKKYKKGEALNNIIAPKTLNARDIIFSTVHAVKGMLNHARIPLSHDFSVEVSHHYGLKKFNETGCVIINCINREYAKKLIIQLGGQSHPVHYHKLKDETFQVLFGSVEFNVEGKKRILYPGDTLWMPRGVWHGFKTDTGVIIEEVSTTAMDANGDSYYVDKEIAAKSRSERKTLLNNWGRYQFDAIGELI
jgi:sialic acid synthase SpsE/mannose-6-phosphate isomerase-like protein (cupin superfamily)